MLRSLTGSTPVVNAKPVRTRDYSVELQRSGPAALPAIYHNLHMVAVMLSGEPVVVHEGSGDRRWERFAPGESSVNATGPGHRVTWPNGVHCIYVHLHPRLVSRIGRVILGEARVTLETRRRLRDPVIRDIGFQLNDLVAAAAPVDARAADDLVLALTHHVVASYPAPAQPAIRVGALSVEAILDVFREEGPTWDGVTALATQCGLSRSHFSRRVRALAGISPYAMVLGSRIEAVKNLLEQGDTSLREVAYATGFADQSHLTRVFLRKTGVTPARYRTMRLRTTG